MFWFAWTNYPSINFMASIAAGVPFGAGVVLIFLGIMNYLIDSYTIFAASVLAANSVMRSLFGAAFPLFTTQMYNALGIHWASTIPAFLALVCVPFPFIFYKYGPIIRKKCKFAAESDAFLRKMQNEADESDSEEDEHKTPIDEREMSYEEKEEGEREPREPVEERANSIADTEHEEENDARFQPIRTVSTRRTSRSGARDGYQSNPFDLDRVNTRDSFKSNRRNSTATSRASSLSRTKSGK